MDNRPSIIVRVDAAGALLGVEVEGQSETTELVETKAAGPMPSFCTTSSADEPSVP